MGDIVDVYRLLKNATRLYVVPVEVVQMRVIESKEILEHCF